MISVLEDTTTLDETILDATASCAHCDEPAEYRITATCCPCQMSTCGSCEARLNARWSFTVIMHGFLSCTRCRATFVDVSDAVKVHPI